MNNIIIGLIPTRDADWVKNDLKKSNEFENYYNCDPNKLCFAAFTQSGELGYTNDPNLATKFYSSKDAFTQLFEKSTFLAKSKYHKTYKLN